MVKNIKVVRYANVEDLEVGDEVIVADGEPEKIVHVMETWRPYPHRDTEYTSEERKVVYITSLVHKKDPTNYSALYTAVETHVFVRGTRLALRDE
jgi:hypothetical protein